MISTSNHNRLTIKDLKMRILLCVIFALLTMLAMQVSLGADPTTSGSAAALTTQIAPVDAGADLVAAFYKVLLQQTTPTLEQEKAIFDDASAVRGELIAKGAGSEKEAVYLQYCWKHKDLFLPKNTDSAARTAGAIHITTTFVYARTIEHQDSGRSLTQGSVMAAFREDFKDQANKGRLILFMLSRGKLDPSPGLLILDYPSSGKTMRNVIDEEYPPFTPEQIKQLQEMHSPPK